MASESKPTASEGARVIFSAPELLAIRQALQESASAQSDSGAQVWFDGGLVDDHVQVELRFADLERTRVLTMVAASAVDLKDAKDLVAVRAGIVEFIGAMFEEWIQEEGLRSPSLDWKEHTYAERAYLFRGELVNEKSEAEADAFLRQHGLDPEHLWDDDEDFDENVLDQSADDDSDDDAT